MRIFYNCPRCGSDNDIIVTGVFSGHGDPCGFKEGDEKPKRIKISGIYGNTYYCKQCELDFKITMEYFRDSK